MNQQPTATSSGQARIGRYRLLTRIGEGGMGVVHLAQGPDGTRVALKVLRQHVVGDDEARERLAREVASLRRVTSPRVAEVIDADPWGETPFVATRFVPGLSLHQHVREEGPVLGHDLALLATGLMEAVVAVHRVGVLHRDIKPSNVLMEGRAPVLIDFGLARVAEDPRLTRTGWLLGTPGYLAPEILYGDDATPASDVHSWAATVVFAATGRPPFGTGPALAIMDRVRRGEHDLSAVPPALLPLVSRCLAPEPADRPSTHEVLTLLRSTAPPSPRRASSAAADAPTMPFQLAGPPTQASPTPAPGPAPLPTAMLPTISTTTSPTMVTPDGSPPRTHLAAVTPATREPYVAPPPPRQPVHRPSRPGVAGLHRGLLLGGVFATVALGFARAPYLSLLVLCLVTLVVRTASWTTESADARQRLRGRRRWYDGPLTLLSVPWYLLVATAGTLLLLLWSAMAAFAAGFAYLLFGAPPMPGLVLMGAVLASSLWWGPGSRRVRAPARRVLAAVTSTPWVGWLAVAVVTAVVALCAYTVLEGGVVWEPSTGPPWRSGTLLGRLLRWV